MTDRLVFLWSSMACHITNDIQSWHADCSKRNSSQNVCLEAWPLILFLCLFFFHSSLGPSQHTALQSVLQLQDRRFHDWLNSHSQELLFFWNLLAAAKDFSFIMSGSSQIRHERRMQRLARYGLVLIPDRLVLSFLFLSLPLREWWQSSNEINLELLLDERFGRFWRLWWM